MLSTTKNFSCNCCGREDFPSRNKLFSHIKLCTIQLAKINVPKKSVEGTFIYVTGGRIRGKTLGRIEEHKFIFSHRK